MNNHRNWIRKLTEFARPVGEVTTAEQDAQLAPFTEQLDRLRTLAETARDSLTASTYDSVWREMGEELGLIAEDLENREVSVDELAGEFEEWKSKGRRHLARHPEAAKIFQPSDTADQGPAPQSHRIDLGGGAVLHMPGPAPAPQADQESAHGEVMQRIANLMTRADTADMNAERLEDADAPAQADRLREAATQMRREADQMARDAGLASIYDYVFDEETDDDTAVHKDAETASAIDDLAEASKLQHEYRVESDVRAAYDMSLLIAEDNGVPDKRWLRLADLRAELDYQAHQRGQEPHPKEEVDAALQRLTHDTSTTVHVIPEDHKHLLTAADRHAAVRFGDADRHMIYIEHLEYDKTGVEQAGVGEQEKTAGQIEQTHEAVQADASSNDSGEGANIAPSAPHDQWPAHPDPEGAKRDVERARTEQAMKPGSQRLEDPAEIRLGGEVSAFDDHHETTDDLAELTAAADAEDATMAESATAGHVDKSQQQDDERAGAEPISVSAERGSSELSDDADTTPAGQAAEVEPVAVSETTACAVAVTRAHCAVDRARQQLEEAQRESADERDDELARWHADDTTARVEAEQATDDSADEVNETLRSE